MSPDDVPLISELELVAVTVGTPERLDGPVVLVEPHSGRGRRWSPGRTTSTT